MAVIIALDVGVKTIGLAICDSAEKVALPVQTLLRNEGYRRDMTSLVGLFQDRMAEIIVVGYPLNMDGSQGERTQHVDEFVRLLKRYTRLPICLEDERLSTYEAHLLLDEVGIKRKKQKRMVDSLAAVEILQSFLDRRHAGITVE